MFAPAYNQQLVAIADRAAHAPHGQRESIYQAACVALSVSRATLLKHLKTAAVMKPRKQRNDAGQVTMPKDEAEILSAWMNEGYRKNARKITSLKEAVEILRANGEIKAATLDKNTGELIPLSDSAISRALTAYGLHPNQLRRATPCTNLQSLHPNHCWQVDASVCVIYYLPGGDTQMVELDEAVHYKNKPENLRAIEKFRVIRYVLADHASGLIRYRYYPHSESGEHTVRFLAWAMAKKQGNDPFHGRPDMLMVDPGATSGGLVKRFCYRMGIKLIINKVHNARAKGAVEKGNHLIETSFEQTLRFLKPRPASFEELNGLAETYQLWWNATKVHTRTKKTRFAVWLTITAEQLIITPCAEVLLELATQEPIKRKVQQDLTTSFKGRIWDVSEVPGVTVKGDIYVHWHPFMIDTAMAVLWDEHGHEQHIALPEIKINALGFKENAAVMGEEHKAKGDTVLETNRKRIQQIAAGTNGIEETEKKRGSKDYIPFNGKIDPLLTAKQALPDFLPKRGTVLELSTPTTVGLKLNSFEMVKWLKGRMGAEFAPEITQDLLQRYPDGATEIELEAVLQDLQAGRSAKGGAVLRVVNG